MSGRDDIDVVNAAEDSSGKPENADSVPNGDTIRQNSPTDSTAKKPSFFERLKRAFSTDEDPEFEDSSADRESSGEDLLGTFFEQVNKPAAQTSGAAEDVYNIAEQTDRAEAAGDSAAKTINNSEPDPAEEEELLMINAFLEGEEYIPSANNTEQNDDYDSQNAFDEEDVVFEVDDENEDLTADEGQTAADDNAAEPVDNLTADDNEMPKGISDAENTAAPQNETAEDEAKEPVDNGEQSAAEIDKAANSQADETASSDENIEAKESVESGESAAEIDEAANSQADETASSDENSEAKESVESSESAAEIDEAAKSQADENASSDENIEAKESVESGESAAQISEAAEPLIDEDDEEFVFEEDFLFDESDDELADLAKMDGTDEFGELSSIFKDDDDKNSDSGEAIKTKEIPDTKEYPVKSLLSEPLEADQQNDEAEENTADQADSDDLSNDEQAQPDVTAETADDTSDSEIAVNTDESAEEKSAEQTIISDDSEQAASAESTADENPGTSGEEEIYYSPEEMGILPGSEDEKPKGGLKGFFKDVKTKLVELWNAREETNAPETPTLNSWETELISENTDSDTETMQVNETEISDGGESVIVETDTNAEDNDTPENAVVVSEIIEETVIEIDSEDVVSGDNVEISANAESEVITYNDIEISENTESENITDNDIEITANAESENITDNDIEISENTESENITDNDIEISENTESENIIDKDIENTENTEPESGVKTPRISVITNENATRTVFDEQRLRGQLNVIERDETDVLTDEQKQELENNKRVLDRVREFEQQTEEMRREAVRAEQNTVNVITELEVTNYRPEGESVIRFPTGRFGESVRSEYDCIINYKKMISVSTKEALVEAAPANETQPDEKNVVMPEIGQSNIPEFREARDYERNHDKVDSIGNKLDYQDERNPEPIEYRTEDDALEVRKHLGENRRRDSWVSGATIGLTAAAFLFSCFAGLFTVGKGADAAASSERIFAVVNLALYAGALFCCKDIIIGGLKPLKKFKANSDSGVAAASVAAALQAVLAIAFPVSFMSQGLNIYTLVVMLTLSVFALGRYMNSDRIAANFRFVSDTAQKYAGKFFPDPRMVAKLLSGTRNDKTELSFQKKTTFLKHFVKLSNTEDPGDKLASSFALPAMILSALIALIAGIVSKSFLDGWSVLCVMLCMGIPVTSRALASIPIHNLAKKSLLNKSMIVGYSAIDTFSESAAVMIDAKDLYPAGSIQMNDFKALDSYRWQDGLYAAAAVTIAAGGATAGMFESMIDKNARDNIPTAEGVMYEDGKGLVGWVKNERVYVGNRQLLRSHGIYAPSEDDEEAYRAGGDVPLYIAVSGRLVGVLLVGYTANRRVSDVLKRMEASDMSLLVRTTDVNITAERIAHDFGISLKSIKVLEQKNSNFIRDEMIGKEKSSPAFIATKGGVTSFGLAVSECIQTKRDITLSLAVEIVGALLKILVVTAIVLFAGIHHIGAIQLFMFSMFWVGAVLLSPLIVQKIQNINISK